MYFRIYCMSKYYILQCIKCSKSLLFSVKLNKIPQSLFHCLTYDFLVVLATEYPQNNFATTSKAHVDLASYFQCLRHAVRIERQLDEYSATLFSGFCCRTCSLLHVQCSGFTIVATS